MVAITTRSIAQKGWREIEHQSFCVGVDLGQTDASTGIAVIDYRSTLHEHVKGFTKPHEQHYDVRFLRRLPPMDYLDQATEIALLMAREPLLGSGAELIVDCTDQHAMGDLLESRGLRPVRVHITGSDDQRQVSERFWTVPKHRLIGALDGKLNLGQLRIAAELAEAGALAEEMSNFRRLVGRAGRYSFEPRSGKSDDLILSVALGLWGCIGRPRPAVAAFGYQSSGKERA